MGHQHEKMQADATKGGCAMTKTWKGAAAVLVALGGTLAGCSAGGPVDGSIAGPPSNTGSVAPPTQRPNITVQPTDAAVITDATATFSVGATGAAPSYQWQRDGRPISGATAATYTLSNVSYQDEGAAFTVVVSNKGGSVTSQTAHLHLALSDDQKVFESQALASAGGIHELVWNLMSTGAQVPGRNYLYTDYGALSESPLTKGPQRVPQTAPVNLAASLALPVQPNRRVLKDGAILVVPDSNTVAVVAYEGTAVRVDTLADDGHTVAWSQLRSAFSSTALTGAVASAPDELAHAHYSLFANPASLDPAAIFKAGAAYVKYTAAAAVDDYRAFDCYTTHATTGKDLDPCQFSSSLEAMLGPGWTSYADGRTYRLEDGAITTIGGVRVWVAKAARPQAATLSATVKYRTYFEMRGNVYAGDLTKAGTVLGGGSWVSDPTASSVVDQRTFLEDQIRLNRAARDSIAAAVKF